MLPRGKPYGSILFMIGGHKYMKIQDILSIFRKLAPEGNQSSWDNSGVQVAGTAQSTDTVAVTLEPTPEAVGRCLDAGAGVIITHHPLYMQPKAVSAESMYLDVLRQVLGAGAWLYSAHTLAGHAARRSRLLAGPGAGTAKQQNCWKWKPRARPWRHPSTPRRPSRARPPTSGPTTTACTRYPRAARGEVRVVCDEEDWRTVADKIEFSLGSRPLFYLRSLTAPRREAGFGEVGDLPRPMGWDAFLGRMHVLAGRDVLLAAGPTAGHGVPGGLLRRVRLVAHRQGGQGRCGRARHRGHEVPSGGGDPDLRHRRGAFFAGRGNDAPLQRGIGPGIGRRGGPVHGGRGSIHGPPRRAINVLKSDFQID